jgi:hypothetical protein
LRGEAGLGISTSVAPRNGDLPETIDLVLLDGAKSLVFVR